MQDLEKMKQLARSFVSAMGAGDSDRFAACFTPDAVLETTGTLPVSGRKSVDHVCKEVATLGALFPDGMRFQEDSITCEGNRVIVELRGLNKLRNGLEYPNRYVFILEYHENGKIKELREYQDTALVQRVLMPSFQSL